MHEAFAGWSPLTHVVLLGQLIINNRWVWITIHKAAIYFLRLICCSEIEILAWDSLFDLSLKWIFLKGWAFYSYCGFYL